MQPYFLPYIGYFQLISAADKFVIYDNIEYTKKGWINRNRMLSNKRDTLFSIALKKAPDHAHVCEREIADSFKRAKFLNQIKGAYSRAPYFSDTYKVIEEIIQNPETNLFNYIKHSVKSICAHLDIDTKIITSSEVNIDHTLKGQDKVIAICRELGASTYINASGGKDLYTREAFLSDGITLKFIETQPFQYPQFGEDFIPWLSILDVMMFNSPDVIKATINNKYDLV